MQPFALNCLALINTDHKWQKSREARSLLFILLLVELPKTHKLFIHFKNIFMLINFFVVVVVVVVVVCEYLQTLMEKSFKWLTYNGAF